jgi:hypothetical protein
MAGKGSRQRKVNKPIFDQNYDQIIKKENIDKDFKPVKIGGKVLQRKVYKGI